MATKETSGLVEICSQIIETRFNEPRISRSSVATEAMVKLRAKWMLNSKRGYPLVYLGCHLELRQIARQILRERFEPEEDINKPVHPLFPELQWRYPIVHQREEEPQYVLLELLEPNDWRFNVKRLRLDAASRLRHADALEAWGFAHFAGAPVS
jgi:hypothetical protein